MEGPDKNGPKLTPEIVEGLKRINAIDDEIDQLQVSIGYRQIKHSGEDAIPELVKKIEDLRAEKDLLLNKITYE